MRVSFARIRWCVDAPFAPCRDFTLLSQLSGASYSSLCRVFSSVVTTPTATAASPGGTDIGVRCAANLALVFVPVLTSTRFDFQAAKTALRRRSSATCPMRLANSMSNTASLPTLSQAHRLRTTGRPTSCTGCGMSPRSLATAPSTTLPTRTKIAWSSHRRTLRRPSSTRCVASFVAAFADANGLLTLRLHQLICPIDHGIQPFLAVVRVACLRQRGFRPWRQLHRRARA